MTTKALAAAMLLSVVGVATSAAPARAQGAVPETPAVEVEDEAEDEAAGEPDTRWPLRVLENPYDISSFYRSSDSYSYGYYREASERYSIADFYRQRDAGPYGYAMFWADGYSDRDNGRRGVGSRRSIGENGDLFLFAPAFLGPVGPLTGVFFDGHSRGGRGHGRSRR